MTVMETDNGLCLTVVIVLLQLCPPPLAVNICLHEIQSNRNPAKKENQIRLSSKKIQINSHKKKRRNTMTKIYYYHHNNTNDSK